jgi:phosphoribosylamine-glycine ligase
MLKFVFFFYECYPLPLAYHLKQEGYEVILGAVPSVDYLKLPDVKNEEKPEERVQRHSTYRGLLDKKTVDQVLRLLAKVPKAEKDDYFIFFDFNDMYSIAETVVKMGFHRGLFPTEWYYRMEKERNLAKQFVKKHYKDIKVADAKSFTKVQDGIQFLKESDKTYVLKSNGNQAGTRVPKTENVDEARELLIKALTKEKQGYEAGGFLLEEKIPNCQEVTPVMMFYNGKPVYSLVEFESKSLGAGDIGLQKGGNLALSVKTELNCKLNKMSFPPIVYELAKKQPGMSVFDIGLLYNGEDFYFTEFCAMRYGWDGVFSELVMRDDGHPFVANYFMDIMKGDNPLVNKYGASVRLFNLGGHMEGVDKSEDDIEIKWKDKVNDNLFLYRIRKQEGSKDLVSVGGLDLLGVATGASDILETAVNKAYNVVDGVTFESMYYRPKFDFLSLEYKSSLLNRFSAVKQFFEE